MRALSYLTKSRFVRSIFITVLSILMAVSIAIVAIVFFSFTTEINRSIIAGKQNQLALIESTISKRLDELSSIAYSISDDPTFLIEPVDGVKYTGYEMANTLSRYLVGNGFIEHLSYYRLAEPDIIYTARGELRFHDFFTSYIGLTQAEADDIISQIQSVPATNVTFVDFGGGYSYFLYNCPLPQFSANPQAFVLAMIPTAEVASLLEAQLADANGIVAVFDADGNTLYSTGALDRSVLAGISLNGPAEAEYINIDGVKYVLQRQTSASNGWTYISLIRLNDIVSGLAWRQIAFIVLLLVLMFVAMFVIFIYIAKQYKPINSLAEEVTSQNGDGDGVIDERELLSSRFATLTSDSEQKHRFEAAYHEADAANKAKSAFLSSMSHDIRTPMNAIIGMTAIALKHTDEPDYVKECLGKVQVASQYLLDIINNVLDMSRIESGRFTLANEAVDLPGLVYGLITILNQSVEAKRQKLAVEVSGVYHERFMGDSVRLTQVFMNILSNAVKFTPEGGVIAMRITENASDEPGYGSYVFSFTDTGIGMAPEFVEHVFDTFSRASDSNVDKVEGTGLGMSIAKNLVELMGGSIVCDSRPGAGTTFTVTLHMQLAASDKPDEAPVQSGQRALIVGDEESVCVNQSGVFNNAGANAVYTLSPAEAEVMLRRANESAQPYDFVIVNYTNAHDSLALIQRLAAICASGATLVLAARSPERINREEVERAGIAAIVRAPLFRSTVLHILNRSFDAQETPDGVISKVIDLSGRRVLIAEDNSINREIARRLISETGAQIEEAVDGAQAVELFIQNPPGYYDLILMDLQMPELNGYEATARIRALDRCDAAAIKIYALTASTFDEDVRQVLEAGMNGHLGKPYTPEALYAVLARAFA